MCYLCYSLIVFFFHFSLNTDIIIKSVLAKDSSCLNDIWMYALLIV